MRQKTGVVSCSGECCSLGTLSRVAVRLTLEEKRPDETVTLCLPLFLAGGEGEREFARLHPTVAVDGCRKLCAKKGIEKHSGPTAASVNVEELLVGWGEEKPENRRKLDSRGVALAYRIADAVAAEIDKVTRSG
jgi:uncharacterized metal-binding protein